MHKIKSIDYEFDRYLFADHIIMARWKAKLTQRETAEMLDVETQTYAHYESPTPESTPNMKNFISVCNLFDLHPTDYFCLSDRVQPERTVKDATLKS